MDKSMLELQGIAMSEADLARAVAIARPANEKARGAADAGLEFEDEPAHYLGFLHAES
ncbi:MAG: hypothetical protein QOD26_4035 [Betaproteobacteria bacterium]|jgi:hypothetical protein|nr:hypothetical protein [Betaproteobacteria bacterium]